jgi:hypothetical protein
MSNEEPKIIVDDDWKSQVEKEKAMAAGKSVVEPDDAISANEPEQAVDDRVAEMLDVPPPATMETLVSMLFTQALAALGQLPGADGKPGQVNKPFAKYFIDSLEMLGEKTKGNLTDDESKMISETLHAMRMAFVSIRAK